MKSKSILVDCHVFDGGFQGSRTYIEGLYKEFISFKDVNFYFAAQDIENLKKIFGNESNVHYVKLRFKNKYLRLLYDFPAIIRKYKVEFAHFQYVTPFLKDCKFVTSTHDVLFLDYPEYFPWSYRISKKWLFYLSCLRSDFVFTGSFYSKLQIQKHFKIENVFHTPYGIQSVFFEPYDKEQVQNEVFEKYGYKDFIVFVSRREPRKNHLALLKTFVELSLYHQYWLVFIGDKDLNYKEFDEYYESLNESVKTKIITLEKLPFLEMVSFIRASRLCVYPSKAEGFGLPPLESAAARVPTICSNTTSMGEFDILSESLVDPYNLEEMKLKMTEKLSELDLSQLNTTSNLIQEKYNWSVIAKQYYEILFKDA
ncbi:MAG: glycosyltransferase family 4 protein [Flavobacterium sp.]